MHEVRLKADTTCIWKPLMRPATANHEDHEALLDKSFRELRAFVVTLFLLEVELGAQFERARVENAGRLVPAVVRGGSKASPCGRSVGVAQDVHPCAVEHVIQVGLKVEPVPAKTETARAADVQLVERVVVLIPALHQVNRRVGVGSIGAWRR